MGLKLARNSGSIPCQLTLLFKIHNIYHDSEIQCHFEKPTITFFNTKAILCTKKKEECEHLHSLLGSNDYSINKAIAGNQIDLK